MSDEMDDHERDDLDEMLGEIAEDPAARAAYHDAIHREDLLVNLVRARKKLSQKKVAIAMGTTQSAISDIENGRVDPRLSTLQRYARAVGKRLAVILKDEPEVPSEARAAQFIESASGASGMDDSELNEEAQQLAVDKSLEEIFTELIRKEQYSGPQSASDVAKSTGLPEHTLHYAMSGLCAAGWLDVVSVPHSREPKFSLHGERGLMIGMSMSRGRISGVLTDLRVTRITAEDRPLPDSSLRGVVQAVNELVGELRHRADSKQEIVGLGVTLAGLIDGSTGTVYFAPDLQTNDYPWKQAPLETELQVATSLRTVVENDANALGMYEYLIQGVDQTVAVVLLSERGEGVGSGLVINGAVAHGVRGVSGEIGHIVMDPNGKLCRCGTRGCLETMVGAAAVVRFINERSNTVIESLDEASNLVEKGDRLAAEAFATTGEFLGQALERVTAIVGSARITIFGPKQLTQESDVASAKRFLQGVRRKHGSGILGAKIDILPKVLDDVTLPQAAAATAVHYFISRPRRWVPDIANLEPVTRLWPPIAPSTRRADPATGSSLRRSQ